MQKLLASYTELQQLGVPYSDEHLRRLIKLDRFPRPVKLGDTGHSTRKMWVVSEIVDWVNSRIKERDAQEAA